MPYLIHFFLMTLSCCLNDKIWLIVFIGQTQKNALVNAVKWRQWRLIEPKQFWKWAETQKDTLTGSKWLSGPGFSQRSLCVWLHLLACLPDPASPCFIKLTSLLQWWVLPRFYQPGIQARGLHFCFITSETRFPPTLSLLSELFDKLDVASNMAFTQEWFPYSHNTGQRATEVDTLVAGSLVPAEEPHAVMEYSLTSWSPRWLWHILYLAAGDNFHSL